MLLRRIHYTISIIGSNFLLPLIKAAFFVRTCHF
nr:MAG TPA: hypothetical protein [Bacteriophage sp.]